MKYPLNIVKISKFIMTFMDFKCINNCLTYEYLLYIIALYPRHGTYGLAATAFNKDQTRLQLSAHTSVDPLRVQKSLANQERLCHCSSCGNKADHSRAPASPISLCSFVIVLFSLHSSFVSSLLHLTSTHHSLLCFALSLNSVCKE